MNTVLSPKEVQLGQTKYFILQYLKGCPSPFLTARKIGQDLELTIRTVSQHLRDMREMGVISMEYEPIYQESKIEINHEYFQ
jgi:DNA-binding transcriptional ArsR family regulator